MEKLRNIIVTGSNKGIGYGIVENLAQKHGWNIIMACRNLEAANKAKDQILAKHANAKIHAQQLDVSDKKSIEHFAKVVAEKYKTIDVLINNAGVARKGDEFNEEVAQWTFATNFYGTINLTDAILKNISNSGKIIFVGSMAGKITRLSEDLKNKFRNPKLGRAQLYELMGQFIEGVRNGDYDKKGWPKSCYGISKVGINHFARVLSNEKQVVERNIQVYAMCPGYVNTDMTSHKGVLTIQEGALTPVFLAQLPFEVNPEYQGKFFQRSKLSSLE